MCTVNTLDLDNLIMDAYMKGSSSNEFEKFIDWFKRNCKYSNEDSIEKYIDCILGTAMTILDTCEMQPKNNNDMQGYLEAIQEKDMTRNIKTFLDEGFAFSK